MEQSLKYLHHMEEISLCFAYAHLHLKGEGKRTKKRKKKRKMESLMRLLFSVALC